DAAAKAEAVARRTLDAARDRVAEFTPPPLSREDLAADWAALSDWARVEAKRRSEIAAAAMQGAHDAKNEAEKLIEEQKGLCVEAGIEAVTDPRKDCLEALVNAKGLVGRIEQALETAKEITE